MVWCLALLVHSTQLAAGWVLWRAVSGEGALNARTAARAILLGPAAIALQMFAYGLAGVPFSLPAVLGPWWVYLTFALWRRPPRLRPPRLGAPSSRARLVALAVVAVPSLLVLLVGGAVPVHVSDGMNNHAIAARALAAHAGDLAALRDLADPGNVHYPPLLALNEALFFLVDDARGAWLVRPFFALGFLAWGLLVRELVVGDERPVRGVLVLGFVLCTPEPVQNALLGLADVRLLGALAVAFVALRDRLIHGAGAAPIVAAGVALALTKHEGLVAAGALAAGMLVVHYGTRDARGGRPLLRGTWTATAALTGGALAWPVYAAASGLADVPVEIRPAAIDGGTLLAALPRVPAAAAAVLSGWFAADVEGIPRWGAFWPVTVVLGACARGTGAALAGVLWVLHLVAVAAGVAVLAAGFGVAIEWVTRSTTERLLLPQMVWAVLLLGRVASSPVVDPPRTGG